MAQTHSHDASRLGKLLGKHVSWPMIKSDDSNETQTSVAPAAHKSKSFAGRTNNRLRPRRSSLRDSEFAGETDDDRDLEKFVRTSGVDIGMDMERGGVNFARGSDLRARLSKERIVMMWKSMAKVLVISEAVRNAREQMKISMLGAVPADFSRMKSSASNYYAAEVFSGLFDDNLVIFEPPSVSFLRRDEFRECLDSLERKKRQEYLDLLSLYKTANRAVLAEDEDGELEHGAFVDLGRSTPQLRGGEEESRRAEAGVFFERRPSTGEAIGLTPSISPS